MKGRNDGRGFRSGNPIFSEDFRDGAGANPEHAALAGFLTAEICALGIRETNLKRQKSEHEKDENIHGRKSFELPLLFVKKRTAKPELSRRK